MKNLFPNTIFLLIVNIGYVQLKRGYILECSPETRQMENFTSKVQGQTGHTTEKKNTLIYNRYTLTNRSNTTWKLTESNSSKRINHMRHSLNKQRNYTNVSTFKSQPDNKTAHNLDGRTVLQT